MNEKHPFPLADEGKRQALQRPLRREEAALILNDVGAGLPPVDRRTQLVEALCFAAIILIGVVGFWEIWKLQDDPQRAKAVLELIP